jgi:hypothetical protein
MALDFPLNPQTGDRYAYGDTLWRWNGNAWDNISGGAVAYTHIQGTSSAVWNITHNLKFYPNVTTIDSSGAICEGEINYTNPNSLTVTFTAAFSGTAYLS